MDYIAQSGMLTFEAGDPGFNVPIIFDDLAEGPETVNLTLSDPTGTVLGGWTSSVLLILDSPPFIQIGFGSPSLTVSEKDSSALVTVIRQGSISRTVTVQFAASSGSATAGLDFIGTNGTLTFGPRETVKTFSVPLLNDGLAEPTETVNLMLSNPSGGATVGQSYATLSIHDAGVQFSQSYFQVTENAGGPQSR